MSTIYNFARMDSTRLLAFGGIAFVVCALLAGELYAIYVSHVANGVIGRTWPEILRAVVGGDVTALSEHFAVIDDLTAKRGRIMNTHSHLGGYGFLALALSYLQPYLGLDHRARRRVAIAFLIGAGVHCLGVYVSYYVGVWTAYVGDLGALMVIGACGAALLSLRAGAADAPPLDEHLAVQLGPSSARYLMKAGLLLMILGMVFGLYYAWVLVTEHEPALYDAINSATALTAQGSSAEAVEQIGNFKRMQSRIAITAAAHSHAVEFGFLMLLLALVQRFVLLSDQWRLNWARFLSVGAFALPVCVYLANTYGLRAAAFSDLFGGVALVGLLAMAFGIVRHTGVADQQTAPPPGSVDEQGSPS